MRRFGDAELLIYERTVAFQCSVTPPCHSGTVTVDVNNHRVKLTHASDLFPAEFYLPVEVDPQSATAALENGVLEVVAYRASAGAPDSYRYSRSFVDPNRPEVPVGGRARITRTVKP